MRHVGAPLARDFLETLQIALDRSQGGGRPVIFQDGDHDIVCFPIVGGYAWPFDIVIGPGIAQLRVHLLRADGRVERTLSGFRITGLDGGLDLDRTYVLMTGMLANLRPHLAECPLAPVVGPGGEPL